MAGYFIFMLHETTKIAILGFGQEGKSLLKFLKKSHLYKNANVSVLDKKLDKNYLKNLERFNIIFRSPGMPYNLPEIQNALKKGVKISSGTELFFEQLRGFKNIKIIGVTGTKGKGTTSTLIYKILKAAGKLVYLAGNIGKPALEILPELNKNNSIVILELSSFQLHGLKYSPDIAIVLDIFPDHMDAHKNFKEYIDAKSNIAKWQKKTDKIFYFADNKYSKQIAQKSRAKKNPVDSRRSHVFAILNRIIKIPGAHNLKNAVMATNVAKHLGVPNKIILKTIKNFRGLEHRLELVRTIRVNPRSHPRLSASIVKFYNDSASTNPQTAAAAIRAFPKQSKILIVGGKDKGLNYSPLAQALKNSNTKLVILFGENKNKIAKAILSEKHRAVSIKYKVRLVKNLKTAVNLAYRETKILNTKYFLPSTIIFSPASASFDMFKDYKDRGNKFKKIVKILRF